MSVSENKTGTLRAEEHGHQPVVCIQGNIIDRADTAKCNGKGWAEDKSFTLNTIDRPAVYDARGNGNGSIVPTLTGDHQDRVTDYTALCVGNGQLNQISMSDKANALDTMHDQQAVMTFEAFGVDSERQTTSTLKARNDGTTNCDLAISQNSVRRLTPLECERLQGLPDNYTNIPGASDSQRYRAIGNGIALPFGSTSLTALLRWAR